MMELRKNTKCLESEQEHMYCCFKVVDKQIELAKATLFVNPSHDIQGEHACAVGHLTCVHNQEVFTTLMDGIVAEVRKLGHKHLIGPMNGSTWNDYRLINSAGGESFLLDTITPEYHISLYKEYGYEIIKEYRSTMADKIVLNWEMIKDKHDEFVKAGIKFRGFQVENAEEEFRSLWDLCCDSFSSNFLYSPITEGNFVKKMTASLPLINPRYTIMAWKDDKVVGFIFCYPNLKDVSGESVVVKTLARSSERAYQGLGSVLSGLAMRHVKEDGYTKAIHALMAISNTSTYISSKFKSSELRKYALMGLKIK